MRELPSHCDHPHGLETLIQKRIQKELDQTISEEQAGFRPGRGTVDHIFSLRQLQRAAREGRQPLFIALLDFMKAYDSIDRQKLLECLTRRLPAHYCCILRALLARTRYRVWDEGLSDPVESNKGAPQGRKLSPQEFIALLDDVVTEWKEMGKTSAHPWGFAIRVPEELEWGMRALKDGDDFRLMMLSILLYADDVALVAGSTEALQEMVSAWEICAAKVGLHVSASKSHVIPPDWELAMPIPTPHSAIKLQDGQTLDFVSDAPYLGSILQSDGSNEKDFNKRFGLAIGAWTSAS